MGVWSGIVGVVWGIEEWKLAQSCEGESI